jgi:hypothetical protein
MLNLKSYKEKKKLFQSSSAFATELGTLWKFCSAVWTDIMLLPILKPSATECACFVKNQSSLAIGTLFLNDTI